MTEEIFKSSRESAYKNVEREALARTTAQEKPKAILLGGQPGSGKSVLSTKATQEMHASGGAMVIDADRMRTENPYYRQLLHTDPQNAADRTQKEAGAWADRLTLAAIENRRNLVVDGTMRNPENIRGLATRLKEHGYWVEARVMAVNPEISMSRARLRFEQQVAEHGTGRFVNKEQHDNAYIGMAESVRVLERDKLVDAMRIHDANHRQIYENSQERGEWKKPAAANEALAQERDRALTPAERSNHISTLDEINTLVRQRESIRDSELGESRRVIDLTASHQGLVVRDAQELKRDVKGEVVATSSHHTLVKMSDLVAVRYEKRELNRDVQVGEKVTIQRDNEKSQVYEQGKEPTRNRDNKDISR